VAYFGVGNLAVATSPAAGDDAAGTTAPAPPAPVRSVPVGGLIRDGNFAGGMYWEGDGGADPSGRGLAVRLNPSSWTRVYQAFSGDAGTIYSIEVTYRLSPGLTLSQDPADYANISERLEISGFEKFSSEGIPPGNFYGTIGDPNSTTISCEFFAPQLGSTDVQDYQHTYPPIPANGNNTFALAFPPGNGTVTLLTAYVISR
jgi:hypothetical protein